jgi:phage protein D
MDSRTTQIRNSTKFSVTYPDFPSFKAVPNSFKLIQEQGHHDVLELSYAGFNSFYQKGLKTGVLMKLNWETENSKSEFIGHVYSVSLKAQSSMKKNIIVKCVGASFRLKDGGSKVWKNKTASEIAEMIAKEKKLKPIVTKTPIRFGQQSLSGHTYWEKLQELAGRIGYVCQVIGIELHFHPIDKMIDHFSTSIPVLSHHDKDVNEDIFFEGQTLDMFKTVVGSINESNKQIKKDKIVSGLDPITGKKFSHTSSPSKTGKNVRVTTKEELFKEMIPTRVADTPAVAKAMAEGFAQLARFSLHAEGVAQGDPRIAPYRTIDINGTGDETDGNWVVKSAVHYAHYDGRYSVEFTCMTDGTGKNKATGARPAKASKIPTRNILSEMTTGMTTTPTVAKISKKVPLVNQTNAGLKLSSSMWIGI